MVYRNNENVQCACDNNLDGQHIVSVSIMSCVANFVLQSKLEVITINNGFHALWLVHL